MKIKKVTIKNVKSFKDEIPISFNDKLNIFIGPNAGGKSNLLDIIISIIKHYFIWDWRIKGENPLLPRKSIEHTSPFGSIQAYLNRYVGDNSDSILNITLEVRKEDLENMKLLKEKFEKFEEIASSYTVTPLNFVKTWNLSLLNCGQELHYLIKNCKIDTVPLGDEPARIFIQYLTHLDIFAILAQEIEGVSIYPTCLYFSPYRWSDDNNLQVNLSGQNFYNQLQQYIKSTSRNVTSLIKLAIYQLAEVRRNYEAQAKCEGYENKFLNDEKVKMLSKHLNNLGYSWNLEMLEKNTNIYEIILKKNGKVQPMNLTSSGEKEILNFLFGIFAFNIRGGIIVIEEPEIHLHPKWQSIVMDLFLDLATAMNNQFIISTHSSIFINNKTVLNVRRVYKENNATNVIAIKKEELPTIRDLLHIINIQNNEKIFFADKVILTEGIKDRLIIQKLIETFHQDKSVIKEVIEVGGKDNLLKYRRFLDTIKVNNFIIADLDYIFTLGDENIKKLFNTDYSKIEKNIIKNKKSYDGRNLITVLKKATDDNDIETLKQFLEYMNSRMKKLRDNLIDEEKKKLDDFIKQKREEKIFILHGGEIENYLPADSKNLDKVIELIKDDNFYAWLIRTKNEKNRKELDGIVFEILGINWAERREILSSIEKKYCKLLDSD